MDEIYGDPKPKIEKPKEEEEMKKVDPMPKIEDKPKEEEMKVDKPKIEDEPKDFKKRAQAILAKTVPLGPTELFVFEAILIEDKIFELSQ